MGIIDHRAEFLKHAHDELAKRLEKAAIFLENQMKANLSEKCPAYKEHGQQHSPPGGFPYLETGELRRSITHDIDRDNLVARVGTNKIYGRFLNEGTNTMEPREFLEATLIPNQGALKEILKGK